MANPNYWCLNLLAAIFVSIIYSFATIFEIDYCVNNNKHAWVIHIIFCFQNKLIKMCVS